MAEQIALDPNFRRMAETMQGQMAPGGGSARQVRTRREASGCILNAELQIISLRY